jgi:hypothetical protein
VNIRLHITFVAALDACGDIQETFGVIQGTFGVIQGTFGVIQGTFGVIQGTFSEHYLCGGIGRLHTQSPREDHR